MDIELRLSPRSVDDALARVEELRKLVDGDFTDRLASRVADVVSNEMRATMPDIRLTTYVVKSGAGSYKAVVEGYERTDPKGTIFSVSPALYEFGTGVTGAGTYPGAVPPGYVYGAGTPEHQRAHTKTGWFYYDDDGDKVFTRGDASIPFALNAARSTALRLPEIAQEVLRNG